MSRVERDRATDGSARTRQASGIRHPASNIAQDPRVADIVRLALAEDLDDLGDVTTQALVPANATVSARILAREPCTIAGLPVAELVFHAISESVSCTRRVQDGEAVEAGDDLMTLSGPTAAMLTAERTALNILQRLCGIATLTQQFVQAVAGTDVMILDTRKTTPGLRVLEKYAVRCGGGVNHRMGLYDRVLMKDNHRRFWPGDGLDNAIEAARTAYPDMMIEVEVENETELASALQADPAWILLDNMGPDALRRCVDMVQGRCQLEASGGITLDNVRAIAETGVDAISLGCLTHSAPAVDLSLELMA